MPISLQIAPAAPHAPSEQDCVRCGLCLEHCPTYAMLQLEADSPRGRIAIMRALHEGRVEPDAAAIGHLDLCLDCRACETACPSGVEYSALLHAARVRLRGQAPTGGLLAQVRDWFLKNVVTDARRLRRSMIAYGWLEATGLTEHLRSSGLAERLGIPLPPATLGRGRSFPLTARYPAIGGGRAAGGVALFAGCATEALTPEVNRAAIGTLTRRGHSVAAPAAQVCCGALHYHLGDERGARRLAQANIRAFEETGDECIVNCAAGCGAMLKSYGELLADDRDWAAPAARFAQRLRDISEVLAADAADTQKGTAARTPMDCASKPPAAIRRVAYHDACHLCHGQGIRSQPRALLATIPGVELVALNESEMCCGAAGSYALMEPAMSRELARRKWANLLAARPDVVVTGNVGCHVQLLQHAPPDAAGISIMHLVEVVGACDRDCDSVRRNNAAPIDLPKS